MLRCNESVLNSLEGINQEIDICLGSRQGNPDRSSPCSTDSYGHRGTESIMTYEGMNEV
jgi:hypothetical protein